MNFLNFEKRSTWVFWVVIVYLVIGIFSLNIGKESLQGQTGQVWSQVQRGTELLPRLEGLVSNEMSERKDLILALAKSRASVNEAQKSGDLNTAIASLGSGLKAFAEDNNIPSGVKELQQGLLDETAGTYNRITYSRIKLIEAQQGYNQTRIFFFPCQVVFPRVSILGETSSPTAELPKSKFQ